VLKMSRPEHQNPPEIFYNDDEASKYGTSSRMIDIQTQMAERCLELILLPDQPCLLLDVGCGSGLSGEAITDAGHMWVGYDISGSMLNVAAEREVDGDLVLCDMGQGLKLRPGTFDGAISVSALQWLCNIDERPRSLPTSKDLLHKPLQLPEEGCKSCSSILSRDCWPG